MDKESAGVVISSDGSPSTYGFSFVINPKNKFSVKKGQYVQTESEEGIVFGYVSEIVRANRYFERAESVAEYERMGSFRDNFPVNEWEHLVAETKILGTVKKEMFVRTSLPPFPGAQVNSADEELLKKFLGFGDSGLELGNLQHHELKVKLSLTKLLQKHLAILAMSGAGKSHFASVLLEELLSREKEQGRIAIVIIDIHGEYIGFRYDENTGKNVKIIEGKNVRIPFRKVSPGVLFEWFPSLSQAGKTLVDNILNDMRRESKKDGKVFGMSDFLERINSYQIKENIKEPVRRMFYELKRLRIISKKENPKITNEIEPGKMLILDLSDMDNMKKKRMFVSYLGKKLFKLRKKKKIPPFLFLVEEAHNFASEIGDKHTNISKPIIEKIAREGRKFGACLCLISQRPVSLSTTALSQCNTHVILRVTNPNDLKHIGEGAEGIDARMLKNITSLKVGEGIVVGEAVKHPIFLEVRDRKTKKMEKGQPLNEQAKKFEENLEKKKKDVEAFL